MRLKSVKKDAELVLAGVTFETTWADGSIKEVKATDGAGNIVVFRTDNYNFGVLVKEPPKLVKRHQLKGTVAGSAVEQLFDDKYEAINAMNEYQRMVSSDEYCSLEVEQVEVPEEV